MEHLELIFWIIVIILAIISSLARKKTSKKEEEGVLEQLLKDFSHEEQSVTPTTQARATPRQAPEPSPPPPQSPPEERPHYRPSVRPRDITVERQQEELLEAVDLDLIRQGIVLSEILGPPRAENPF